MLTDKKDIHYLMYTSKRNSNCTEKDIEKILVKSSRKNESSEITGILLNSNHSFFQYIEGEFEHLFELYRLIKTDKRHSEVLFISSGFLEERIFPIWNMGYKNIDNKELILKINNSEKSNTSFYEIFKDTKRMNSNTINLMRDFFENG